ncbi:hypothetical protein [Bacillus toyonensis]|uniref:hypothetical protein n=1 Tax=Bacillus toyonensis TaxID=155322 RepID=UPI000BF3DCD8|nr:hypothetical protein [Bacillus toyonensis]PGF05303.1 hypothetical protein COM61_02515 [Bacillus toyonensis]
MRYTNTKEGQELLKFCSMVASTHGQEVYKCGVCDELFVGVPNEVDEKKPVCGICVEDIKRENKDSHGIESVDEDFDY